MNKQTKEKKPIAFFTKAYWQEYKAKEVILNLLIYLSVFFTFFLIDFATKELLFRWSEYDVAGNKFVADSTVIYQSKLIGVRSLLHRGTTLELGLSIPGLHTISFIIIIFTLTFSALVKDKTYRVVIPAFALIASGAMGNMVDRFLPFKGVRDIIFLPWHDTGTFNFADIWLVFGGIYAVISIIFLIIINNKKDSRKSKANQEKELEQSVNFESNNSSVMIDPNQ
ncbi:lipoprotein signal peptidase [Metamycoplasma arthritidis]|uniref:Lipoprotein signal peptidase, signal peptidase II (SPase II) n=1 Tax=Metamycoplasma arthritidis (strain 158L3-1) TaxID=243272 RepID=B3PMY1_META1|nr:signal peptidase II [Metamycoplasma arthritidis]ACF07383.1 lipoprotein signal peptidase, signal peptidase II (SPase II) [Metamycoplasma arthritidis 158L3-1]VEU78904.1 lipoprotein signal peptidase [Metamycoplasma arthritidis]